jgi:hypothetical protein
MSDVCFRPRLCVNINSTRLNSLRSRYGEPIYVRPQEMAPDLARKTAYYPVIALISGFTPKICIIRLRLYANTCKLISVLTLGNVLVRK